MEYCHCGSPMNGSDHCPFCYCEQYESVCNDEYIDALDVSLYDEWEYETGWQD